MLFLTRSKSRSTACAGNLTAPKTRAVAGRRELDGLADLAQQFDVHPNQITTWKGQLLEGAAGVFGQEKSDAKEATVDLKALRAKIGELTLENDFLEGALTKAGMLSAKR